MIAIDKTTSIKSALIWVIMLICSLTLCLAMLVSTAQDVKLQQKKLVTQLEGYVSIIAFNAQNSILQDDADTEENRLKSFKAVNILHNIHIYKKTPGSDELSFFASYNRDGIGPFPVQFSRVQQFLKPYISDNYIELTKAIYADEEISGYVYVRASQEELSAYIQTRILLDILIALIALGSAFFISSKLQKRFTSPIENLLNVMQKVSKQKDYQVRAPTAPIKEYNMLSRAFNTMLDRIEQQISKLQLAEQENRQLTLSLEQKIAERTDALKTSNQELLNTLATLHQYQNQIVETEKMASLGQMVAGVAHEVNTPIGLGVTASTLLQDKLADIQRAFDEKKLTSSQLAKFLSESKENLGIIYRNMERAASLISSFKRVAVDQSNENRRQFNMQQLINEVLLSLRPNLKKTQHQIIVNCPAELELDSKPGPINQILINLIMNSLIHAFEHIEQGEMTIDISVQGSNCQLIYTDNGAGVPESIKKRIFDPFVTTKRGEGGSGLGLHLVYNLVTQALNGKIQLDSTLGHGIRISINFPVIVIKNDQH
ncbi:ATP-binding protein [Rheinheimera aquimaris]|jgi:signal transduction histidine kinase|uniref:ATP-binding protein n=1 Tax=Rheinheimera aquimaris TaxID=412437 RepID=UPI001066F681|nr:ATP-binding protein [Rheinheimera aquimaris]MCD1598520.1 HAMP domain-containing protein [Rheinheimera aquimaris]|tara:strand:+ start:1828 stop:3459 length:1632 start_codon:yes stop_codon:yes gene_type:complete